MTLQMTLRRMNEMPEKGLSQSVILKELETKLQCALSLFPGYIRIVIMPHVKPSHIESFLEDLGRIMKKTSG